MLPDSLHQLQPIFEQNAQLFFNFRIVTLMQIKKVRASSGLWIWLKRKNSLYFTECHQKGHFSTFYLPESFKSVGIFQKMPKKKFDLWPKLGLKITKSQSLCRISIELFLKHTIVHETKFHSFFAKQIFWAIISDTFWLFEHSENGSFDYHFFFVFKVWIPYVMMTRLALMETMKLKL